MPERIRNVVILLEDLEGLHRDCVVRRVNHVGQWCAELMHAVAESDDFQFQLSHQIPESKTRSTEEIRFSQRERAQLAFCQSCFDNREFLRAAWVVRSNSHPVLRFMHFYARYLAIEKKRIDTSAELKDKYESDDFILDESETLLQELGAIYENDEMDSWIYYLYGIVLKNHDISETAFQMLTKSIELNPLFWGAWDELISLIDDRDMLDKMVLPEHWLKSIFLGDAYLRLHLASDAQAILETLLRPPDESALFGKWPYLLNQLASAHHALTPPDLDEVVKLFEKIKMMDPYRLDGMDLYSNTLFVKEKRVELAELAHNVFEVNKFCTQTACVVGNYFAMRGEHERAIVYFQRAIELDPKNAGAWVLIGHEFLELQNQPAATLAYRKAISADPKDYRAWYGLGLGYEIAKMPSWALYYHRQAHKLRPLDSRFLVALGEVYDRLNRPGDAKKAYWKAHSVGDVEGMALIRLGKLYENEKNMEQTAAVYSLFLEGLEDHNRSDPDHQSECSKFLANYYLDAGKLNEAHKFAQDCLEFDKTKEEAKEILKRISAQRLNESDLADLSVIGGSVRDVDMAMETPG